MNAKIFGIAALGLLGVGCGGKKTFDELEKIYLDSAVASMNDSQQDSSAYFGKPKYIDGRDATGSVIVYGMKGRFREGRACLSYAINISPRTMNGEPYNSPIRSTCDPK